VKRTGSWQKCSDPNHWAPPFWDSLGLTIVLYQVNLQVNFFIDLVVIVYWTLKMGFQKLALLNVRHYFRCVYLTHQVCYVYSSHPATPHGPPGFLATFACCLCLSPADAAIFIFISISIAIAIGSASALAMGVLVLLQLRVAAICCRFCGTSHFPLFAFLQHCLLTLPPVPFRIPSRHPVP